jgi:putative flippase GtrA
MKQTDVKSSSTPRQLLDKLASISPAGRRYLVVGVSVYLFELLVIVVAQRQWHASSVVAVGLSFWLGLMVSFGLQKFVTFGDKRTHHRIVLAQLATVSLLVVFNFGFTLLLTKLLSGVVPAVICRTLALGMTTIWNFYLYKTRIFKTSATFIKSKDSRQ